MSSVAPEPEGGLSMIAGLQRAAVLVAVLALHLSLILLYYVIVTPLALALRAVHLEALGLRRDERAGTYWRKRRRA